MAEEEEKLNIMEEMDVTSYAIRTEKRLMRMTHRADEGMVEELSFKCAALITTRNNKMITAQKTT